MALLLANKIVQTITLDNQCANISVFDLTHMQCFREDESDNLVTESQKPSFFN